MDVPLGTPRVAGRAAFGFIFVSAVTTAMSFGLMIPIMPALLKQFTGGDTAAASEWNVVFATVGGVMSLFAGPILGLVSDRLGRRPVLLVSLCGLVVDFLFMALAPSLTWLLVGRMISGATSGAFSTANAYVADVTPPEGRARAFGWMGAAFSFGFLAGPAIGGLLGEVNLRLPFLAAAALTLVNVIYGFLVLPESLPPERRVARFDWRKANPIGSLNLLRSHHELFGLAGIHFLNQLAQMVWPSIFVLYTSYRYGWSPVVTGLYMMAGGVLGVAVQSVLVGPVVARFGERGAMLIGASASIVGFIWYGLAPTSLIYMAAMPISCLAGLLTPGLQGLMTRRVGPSEQGQLQGANQALMGLASVVGPSLFGLSFAWAVRHEVLPGLPLFLAAVATVAALGLAWRTGRSVEG
ncbi:TCR/Tet family MFS transporter [Phenylobacterium sp.]|uniref:TCR/Tet family MFS transporter n=1 Tax=Phenylobacterium sp. TaxID=1871053 RepID=UPI002733AC76|nr:TCR/Tet family MFS transporter [Phenylobacterium sp.]MDP3855959.1 TCR/Tet family MFS transporter [Phenylobacterium sp.]